MKKILLCLFFSLIPVSICMGQLEQQLNLLGRQLTALQTSLTDLSNRLTELKDRLHQPISEPLNLYPTPQENFENLEIKKAYFPAINSFDKTNWKYANNYEYEYQKDMNYEPMYTLLQQFFKGGSVNAFLAQRKETLLNRLKNLAVGDVAYPTKAELRAVFSLGAMTMPNLKDKTRPESFLYYWQGLIQLHNKINSFEECISCALNRTKGVGGILYGTKFHGSSLRNDVEEMIIDDIKKNYSEKNKSINYVGLGSGELFQDFIILVQLVIEGYKNINITLIDSKNTYKSFVNTYKNQSGSREIYDKFIPSSKTSPLNQFIDFFTHLSYNISITIYDDVNTYIKDCLDNNKIKADLLFSLDALGGKVSDGEKPNIILTDTQHLANSLSYMLKKNGRVYWLLDHGTIEWKNDLNGNYNLAGTKVSPVAFENNNPFFIIGNPNIGGPCNLTTYVFEGYKISEKDKSNTFGGEWVKKSPGAAILSKLITNTASRGEKPH